jgi:thiol-disulfide isomerase/thioredoxin
LKGNPEKFKTLNLPNGYATPEVTSSFFYSHSIVSSSKDVAKMIEYAESKEKKSFYFSRDTLLDSKKCFFFRISQSTKSTFWYQSVFIDQRTFLPVSIIQNSTGGSIMIGDKKVSLNQFTRIKYSKVKETIPKFDYLMSDKSLPKDVEITDHRIVVDQIKKGDPAPSWKHPDVLTDKLISLDSLKGKIVVLDFTSTWCFHCVEGSLVIKELYKKYNNHKDVVFINVFSCSTDTREKVQRYIKMRDIDGLTVYYATSSEKPYGILGYPNFCVIDRQGTIAFFQRGYSTNLQELLSREIDQCLGK